MKAFPLNSFQTGSSSLRYKVYLGEIQKRLVYVAFSFFLAWFSAYTQRVTLMYSMTLPLQQAFPLEGDSSCTSSTCATTSKACGNPLKDGQPRNTFFTEEIRDDMPLTLEKLDDISTSLSSTLGINKLNKESTWLDSIDPGIDGVESQVVQATPLLGGDGTVRLIFTDVQEAFYTLLSVSLFWCVVACFPVLLYQGLCFFQPGLYISQSRRVWFYLSRRVLFLYGTLWLVDLFVIPRLLLFFYSFQIERSSLCLHAEIKVVSYVSLYVFVYCITVLLLLSLGVLGIYRRRQIYSGLEPRISTKATFECLDVLSYVNTRSQQPDSPEQQNTLVDYRDQRGNVWWGCLLFAALISPAEISNQLACTFFLIIFSEISIWLGYISSSRFLNRMRGSL